MQHLIQLQVLLLSVTVVSVANLIFVVLRGEDIFRDPSLYTAILEVLVFSMTPVLTYFNHNYTRRSSTILLTFYLYHISSVAISLRTQFALISNRERDPTQAAHLAISVAGLLLLIAAWMLECLGPETDETLDDGFVRIGRSVKESPYLTANAYSRCIILFYSNSSAWIVILNLFNHGIVAWHSIG
jgi:uncharacterized membrane protein